MLEENFLLPIITRELDSPMCDWRVEVAQDLDRPEYKSTFLQAMGFRLRRNYLFIFGILLGGWLVKLMLHPEVSTSWGEIWERMAVGQISSAIVFAGGLLFYLALIVVLVLGSDIHGAAPDDEIVGLEKSLEGWKL
ncbi:MAG: DUF2270 domain-containing protein [Thermoanaerobaculia bacterium]|nr:DUF2270 domain-containing protein [Thermoanaerobaculia bacterium]